MRRLRANATVTAAAGLIALGAVALPGAAARAATGQSVTGCDIDDDAPLLATTLACTAADGTVMNPTSITLTVASQNGQASVTYTLVCSVNGANATTSGSFTVPQSPTATTAAINLQTAVGSPDPNACTVHDLTVSLSPIEPTTNEGATATADTGVPGAIWQQDGSSAAGANADICVDDTANGNVGAAIQVFQCNSDLAQYWVQTSAGQLVRNGDCMDLSGSSVVLAACDGKSTSQQWTVNGTSGTPGTIVNQSNGQCLTAPSAANGTQFTVADCTPGAAAQQWTGPGATPA